MYRRTDDCAPATTSLIMGLAALLLAPLATMGQQFTLEQILFDRLVRPTRVAVSPNGVHVYATSKDRDGIAVLAPDGGGQLALVQYLFDDRDGVNGLKQPTAVAVSPDGAHVYVGSGRTEGIAIFERDATTGALTFVDDDFIGASIEGLAFYGDSFLYVSGGDFLAAFSRNPATGALASVDFESDGVDGVVGLQGARGIAITPDGLHIYVAGRFDDAIAIFARVDDGTLTFVDAIFDGIDADHLAGAWSVGASSDGLFIYASAIFDNALTAFSRNAATGLLTVVDEEIDDTGGVTGMSQPLTILLPSDGLQHLYTTSSVDNSLLEFDRDFATGALTFSAVIFEDGDNDGLHGVRDVAATLDGAQLLTAARTESEVGVFSTTAVGGPFFDYVAPLFDGDVEALKSPRDVAMSTSQTSVYVVSNASTVGVFDRDSASGQLGLTQILVDGVGGVDGLAAPQSIIISGDDRSVYTASWPDASVSHFSRDLGTGELTYVDSAVDGVDGVSGLSGAYAVVLSPDSAHLYAAGNFGDSLALFDRDPMSGALTFVEAYLDQTGGIVGLNGPQSLSVSSDGKNLYAAVQRGGGRLHNRLAHGTAHIPRIARRPGVVRYGGDGQPG